MFRVVLFVLVLSVCNFAESEVKLSKKYIPYSNPGGKDFNNDEEFAKLHKLYEKRRAALKEKKLQPVRKQVKEMNNSSHQSGCVVKDKDNEEDAMINKHGINLARLKGAIFINSKDQDIEDEPVEEDEPIEEDGLTENLEEDQDITQEKEVEELNKEGVQEKKISSMNIIIKDPSSRRRVCSHESVINKYSHNSIVNK